MVQARAISRYNRQSARKIRKVLNKVRGAKVNHAIDYLHFSPEKASVLIEKTIRSAISNLMQVDENSNVNIDSLLIKEAYVNQGPVMKRFRAASMGRASRLRRPTSHLTIVIATD